jgi:hypothetical protein
MSYMFANVVMVWKLGKFRYINIVKRQMGSACIYINIIDIEVKMEIDY